eukprot:COSAG01_NODE_9165_length_2531_cov_969.355674_2_plen_65_part_00
MSIGLLLSEILVLLAGPFSVSCACVIRVDGCIAAFRQNIIVYAVMADILAVMVYGWYRMVKDDE